MKKILFILLTFFICINTAFAIEEIDLEREHINLDYFSNVYYGRVDNAPGALKLFSKNGLEFEKSPINSVKINFLYSGHLSYIHKEHVGQLVNHEFNTVEPGITVNFNDNKTKAVYEMNLTRHLKGYTNRFSEKISFAYVSHNITPEQKIILGQYTRLPVSSDGSKSIYNQDMINRSQLGRTLGNAFSVGVRNVANYKYIDYDLGLYDSTRYMKNFGKGLDFTGNVVIKPLAKLSENKNDIKVGASYNIGKNHTSYSQYSFFADYSYDKFHTKIEFANADGYNGVSVSKNDAKGMYAQLSYDITPKISVIGRYDIFDPNIHKGCNTAKEYSAGITYKLFNNMKLMLNYVFAEGHNKPSSNSILFATRFII